MQSERNCTQCLNQNLLLDQAFYYFICLHWPIRFFFSYILLLFELLAKEKQSTAKHFDGFELNESATWHSSLAPQRNLYLNSPNKCWIHTEAIQNYPTTLYVMHFSHRNRWKFVHYECIDLLRNFLFGFYYVECEHSCGHSLRQYSSTRKNKCHGVNDTYVVVLKAI